MALNLRKSQPHTDPVEDQTRVIRRRESNVVAPSNNHHQEVTPLSSQQIMTGPESREFMLLAGKDGVGKSCAVVSLAAFVELINPDATFYAIDSEAKLKTAIRSFGADAPSNIVLYKAGTMNDVTWAVDQILSKHKSGDWLAVESMSRIWERAQDLGYQAIAGMMKAEYMERRREQVLREGGKPAPVTPQPDQLWSVVKGAHDGAFLDLLTQAEDLNVILTTTLSRPPKEGGFQRENPERKAFRFETGLDAEIEGAPRLPVYIETLLMLELSKGVVNCRIIRDNISKNDETRIEFTVDGKKTWASDFYGNCR